MKPHVICHMITSLDGGLHPSRFTASPDGTRPDWSATYEAIHETLAGDAWIVGRVTMAEMSKTGPHAPAEAGKVERPVHAVKRDAKTYAVAVDQGGKLHFSKADIGGDHVIVLLGGEVPDTHLAELAGDGVSYIVSGSADVDLATALEILGKEFGIRRLLLEGGAGINGSMFAAGLVDELSLLVAPAVDARSGHQVFIDYGDAGLADKVELSLKGCETIAHGLVHLRYDVIAV